MKVMYVVNNYQLGGKVNITSVDKIISKHRIDKFHIEIVYDFDSEKQKEFCDKVLVRTGKIIKE